MAKAQLGNVVMVHAFGSSVNGFGDETSDIDLVLDVPEDDSRCRQPAVDRCHVTVSLDAPFVVLGILEFRSIALLHGPLHAEKSFRTSLGSASRILSFAMWLLPHWSTYVPPWSRREGASWSASCYSSMAVYG